MENKGMVTPSPSDKLDLPMNAIRSNLLETFSATQPLTFFCLQFVRGLVANLLDPYQHVDRSSRSHTFSKKVTDLVTDSKSAYSCQESGKKPVLSRL